MLSPVSLFFKILSPFIVNVPEALDMSLGCLKCIPSMNLSPTNKNVFIISFILYLVLTC